MADSLQRFASGAWLTRSMMTFVASAMIAGTIIALGLLFITADGTVDHYNRPLGTDFSSFWTAGRMALEGQAPLTYDWHSHWAFQRSEEHTSELQSLAYLVCRLLLAKKKLEGT